MKHSIGDGLAAVAVMVCAPLILLAMFAWFVFFPTVGILYWFGYLS